MWKYRWRFLLGLVFIILSNYFRILTPQITGYVVNSVDKELQERIAAKKGEEKGAAVKDDDKVAAKRVGGGLAADKAGDRAGNTKDTVNYDILVRKFIRVLDSRNSTFGYKVAVCGITLLVLALISGFFLFRAFDMFKIYPINKLEAQPGGWGIMLDDCMAGVYTNIILRIALCCAGFF